MRGLASLSRNHARPTVTLAHAYFAHDSLPLLPNGGAMPDLDSRGLLVYVVLAVAGLMIVLLLSCVRRLLETMTFAA